LQYHAKSRWRFPAGIFCFGVLLLLSESLPARQSQSNTDQQSPAADNPPARVARISYMKGNVSFLRAGVDQWSQAALNFPATTGDRIYTDHGARAELQVGPYTIRLSESTDLTITNLTDEMMQLGLQQGAIRLSVYQLSSGDTVEVDTANGALTVVEPGKFRIQTDPDGDHTFVNVDSGRLQITAQDFSQTIEGPQAVQLTGQDPLDVESVPTPAKDGFDIWSDQRDSQLAESESAKYVSRSIPGYSDLDEYGHWTEVEEYGPVWYPVVPAGWVPFRFGHWIWVDPWGWTWLEDEAWGFCPFHFGRWVLIGGVWGWLPGPFVPLPVYAPALVAFLGGAGFSLDLVAWFPLGPFDPFLPWYHYGGDYLRLVNITNIRSVTNITNILNVKNINNVHYAYQGIAATAVPKNVFSSGQPAAPHVAHLNPSQLAKAQIVPHPPVNPTRQAALPGKPVPAPPVRALRFTPANRASPAPNRPAAPTERNVPPPTESTRRSVPPPVERTPPPPRASAARSVPPPLITRNAPPPPPVMFEQRRPVMLEHPGRPLEPLQVEDLRARRPVTPMRDVEFPPHPVPIAPIRPPAPPPIHPRMSPH
jgi:hypothetical protein